MRFRSSLARAASALAVTATLACTTFARADEPPPAPTPGVKVVGTAGAPGGDVVYLKDGGVLRGTIVDALPQRPVHILLATGQIMEIDRAFVDRVVPAGTAPPAPAPSPGSPQPVVPSGPMVQLHVDASRPVEIIGHPRDVAEWTSLCTGACDRPVPVGWEYQIVGAGMKPSAPFGLRAGAGGATSVHVDAGSKALFTLGLVTLSVGGSALIVGTLVAITGANGSYQQNQNGQTTTQHVSHDLLPIGLGIAGAGAALGLIGGLVALDNGSTKVSEVGAPSGPAAAPVAPPSPQVGRSEDPVRLPDVATATLVDLRF